MSISPQQTASLRDLNTLGITASADYLIKVENRDELRPAVEFAQSKGLPILPLGGGSNIVIGSVHLRCAVLKLEIPGVEIINETDEYTDIRIGAGEDWDKLVKFTVEKNLHGIESLSLIPGTVGAAPVQNVGAYGQELHETLLSVEAFDITKMDFVTITNSECHFGYRDSMFKHEGKGRYIITSVTLRLLPADRAKPPTYESLQGELARRNIEKPTVSDIREAVIAVRRSKLPDPAQTPTAGSFFHNPIVSADKLHELQQDFPEIAHWPTKDGRIKLAAAWLVEQCGFKGKVENGVGIFEKQAIALINPGHKEAAEVLAFRDKIIESVQDKFGVTLNMEPELISF